MALLEINDLRTSFFTDAGEVKAVNGVSFKLDHGKVLGIVGESGSGKSVTAYSIMQILASTGKIVGGSIKLDGQELVGSGEKYMRKVRGNKVSIIFQDPMTSLNPTHTIGHQIMEAILLHTSRNRKEAYERAVEMLRLVRINEPEKRMKQYPHSQQGSQSSPRMRACTCAFLQSGSSSVTVQYNGGMSFMPVVEECFFDETDYVFTDRINEQGIFNSIYNNIKKNEYEW